MRTGGQSDVPRSSERASSAVVAPREQEVEVLARLGIIKNQIDGFRTYLNVLAADACESRKRRRADLKVDCFFNRDLTPSERHKLEKRVALWALGPSDHTHKEPRFVPEKPR